MKSKLNKLQVSNAEYGICDLIIRGYSRSDIVSAVIKDYPVLSEKHVIDLYENARTSIVDKIAVNVETVVDLHVKWYEDIWRFFDSVNHVPGKLAALKQKERILGLLKEEKILNITNEVNINLKTEPKYDLSKLTEEERIRMNRYLKMVTRND